MSGIVLIILAEGFEETEAVVPADILQRLGYDAQFAGLNAHDVKGAHEIVIQCKTTLDEFLKKNILPDGVMLPGGLPGAINLRDDLPLRKFLLDCAKNGKIVSAICAAPVVLAEAGLTEGKTVTGYPGSEKLTHANLAYSGNRAETDGNIVTGKGPGAASEFAFELARVLGTSKNEIQELKQQMFYE